MAGFIVACNFALNLVETMYRKTPAIVIDIMYYSVIVRHFGFNVFSAVYPFMLDRESIVPLPSSTDALNSVKMALLDEKAFDVFYDWLELNEKPSEF